MAVMKTRRATVPAMEAMLGRTFPVLDHGFVRVVDYMGDDAAIVQAARVSYGRGTKTINDDRGLIRYLMKHSHTTPFEMCEIKLHVKLPIFVARQWIRHRTASVNEISGRYSILDREFYLPQHDVIGTQDDKNRQGRGAALSASKARKYLRILSRDALKAYDHYERFLGIKGDKTSEKAVARELARIVLPLNYYTQWYWKTDLHNLLHFLVLRLDSRAQYEIREYAKAIAGIVKCWVPSCWEAFVDYRLEAFRLSRAGTAVVRKLLHGQDSRSAVGHMSKGEVEELFRALGIDAPPVG
jgi:thymidylate synthase (FAD)